MWTDWRTTTTNDVGKEETLELSALEDIVAISGYSHDREGDTFSLQAASSAGQSWGRMETTHPIVASAFDLRLMHRPMV